MVKKISNDDIDSLVPVIVRDWENMQCPQWELDWLLDYRLRCSSTIKDTPVIKGWTPELLRQLAENEIRGVDFILDKLTNKS